MISRKFVNISMILLILASSSLHAFMIIRIISISFASEFHTFIINFTYSLMNSLIDIDDAEEASLKSGEEVGTSYYVDEEN